MNDKELAELLERFGCSEGCDEMELADLDSLHGELASRRAELEDSTDKANLTKIGQYTALIAKVESNIASIKAEYAAEVEKVKAQALGTFDVSDEVVAEEVAVEEVVETVTAELDDSLAKYATARPAANVEESAGRKFEGKVVYAPNMDAEGNPIGGERLNTSVDLSRAISNAVETYGNFKGRMNVVHGMYENDASMVTLSAPMDPERTTVEIDRAITLFNERQAEHITADGSFCAPITPFYSFCDLADESINTTQQSLPTVRTIRGRVQYMETPTQDQFFDQWEGIDNDTFAGIGTRFTEDDSIAVDADDDTTWKQCVEVDCPDQQPPAELEAHYTCVTYKHFTWKAYPEYIDLYTRKALLAHQLKESLSLLAQIQGTAQSGLTFEAFPGSITGFFSALDIHATAYREAYWLAPNQVLDIVLPGWVLNMLRAAYARHSNGNEEVEALRASDALFTSLFASINLRPNFITGWQRLATSTDGSGTLLDPIALRPDGINVSNTWPNSFIALLWVPGSVVLLEDPSWNIALERLRDTVLQRQNKYSLFVETFYGLAYPCPYAVQEILVNFCPTGASELP